MSILVDILINNLYSYHGDDLIMIEFLSFQVQVSILEILTDQMFLKYISESANFRFWTLIIKIMLLLDLIKWKNSISKRHFPELSIKPWFSPQLVSLCTFCKLAQLCFLYCQDHSFLWVWNLYNCSYSFSVQGRMLFCLKVQFSTTN